MIKKPLVNKQRILLLICVLFVSIPLGLNSSVGQQVETACPITTTTTISLSLGYSSFLGGSSDDSGNSIAVASDDSYFVIGSTASSNFPMLNSYNDTFGGGNPTGNDAFIAKFSADNILLWSTFLGGSADDSGYSIAIASDDSCFITGSTNSSNFPTLNAYNDTFGGNIDVFVSKFSTNGDLLWSTFLGGSNKDYGINIAVDSADSCFVTGSTKSSNFPTLNAFNDTYSGNNYDDAFVAKFATDGSLLWSTFLGGKYGDSGRGLAITSDDSCFVSGGTASSNFPTFNAYDSVFNYNEIFITKFSSSGSLLWSTFFGGSGHDYGHGQIAVASDDSCFITGSTLSSDLPTLNAYDDTFNYGFSDVFVAKFSTDCSLLWSTYLGGSSGFFEIGYDIEVTSDDSCFVTGLIDSSDFPTLNAFDSTFNGGVYDSFLTKFSASGLLLWSSFLGGNATNEGFDLAITSDDSCYITGVTNSIDFPIQNAYQDTIGGGDDAFVTKFVDDFIEPVISDITHTPENPTTKDNITISCNVTDDSDIQSITLYYRVNNGVWETTAMTLNTSDTYQAKLVLTLQVNDLVEYYIEAIDDSPNHNVAVEDNDGQFYEFTISRSQGISAFGFLTFIVVLPIITLLARKRRK